MTRLAILALAALGGGAAAAQTAQGPAPVALAQAQPGIWEVTGWPGSRTPVRMCVGDVRVLGRFEHQGKACATRVVPRGPTSASVEYQCGSLGFGSSRIDVITPRSLRIRTQGISDNMPFSYTLQARRVAECPQSRRGH